MTVEPHNIRFLSQGLPVGSQEPDYLLLPYRIALLKPSLPTLLTAASGLRTSR